jgi:hypothetical protein
MKWHPILIYSALLLLANKVVHYREYGSIFENQQAPSQPAGYSHLLKAMNTWKMRECGNNELISSDVSLQLNKC